MSGLDLTAAVEAAGRARFEAQFPGQSWDRIPPINRHAWAEVVLPIIAPAAPVIEAQVRERVAAEIEVLMRRHDHAQIGFSAVGDAYAKAARIARGLS